MRWIAAAALLGGWLLGGCTPARMEGFDALAPAGERVDVTGVPGWRDGRFRLGGAEGHVRRRPEGLTRVSGTGLPPEVEVGETARRGTMTFRVGGAEAGGVLEGECRYDRAEGFVRDGRRTLSAVARPLSLDCRYRLDGRDAGTLALDAVPPPAAGVAEPRMGEVRWGSDMLALRSTHAVEGMRAETDKPMGYVAGGADGRPVAAAELNGLSTRRLILPRDPAQRAPALAALLTLALFWDPGDLD